MKITSEREGDCLTLKLSGRLDTSTAPSLKEVVDDELEDVQDLQIDMEQLEYVSSAGLRVLLIAMKRMKAKDGTMVIHKANEGIMEVFKITGFIDILDVK